MASDGLVIEDIDYETPQERQISVDLPDWLPETSAFKASKDLSTANTARPKIETRA